MGSPGRRSILGLIHTRAGPADPRLIEPPDLHARRAEAGAARRRASESGPASAAVLGARLPAPSSGPWHPRKVGGRAPGCPRQRLARAVRRRARSAHPSLASVRLQLAARAGPPARAKPATSSGAIGIGRRNSKPSRPNVSSVRPWRATRSIVVSKAAAAPPWRAPGSHGSARVLARQVQISLPREEGDVRSGGPHRPRSLRMPRPRRLPAGETRPRHSRHAASEAAAGGRTRPGHPPAFRLDYGLNSVAPAAFWILPPPTELPAPEAWLRPPPRTEEYSPVAAFRPPPLTDEYFPDARSVTPPLTALASPVALASAPPEIDAAIPSAAP